MVIFGSQMGSASRKNYESLPYIVNLLDKNIHTDKKSHHIY